MNTKTRKMTGIALSIGALTLVGTAIAGSHSSGMGSTDRNDVRQDLAPTVEQTAPEPYMTEEEVAAALKAKGYSDIKKIELEKGEYEVKARDADGKRVEIYLDPRTGEILDSKYKE